MESVAVMTSDAIPHSFRFKTVASVIRVGYQIIKEQVQKINMKISNNTSWSDR